jgi:hypothetical protein
MFLIFAGIFLFNPLSGALLFIFIPILSAERIKEELKKINIKPNSAFLYSQLYKKISFVLFLGYIIGYVIILIFLQVNCDGSCPELGNLDYIWVGGLSIFISLAYISIKTNSKIKSLILEKSEFKNKEQV